MAIDDQIKALTKQLYPTGRVWRINPNSVKEKFINGLLASEIRAYNDAVSILDSTLPDNPNFTVDDAAAWEIRLGLPDGSALSLSDRIKAIEVQLNWPGTNPAKGAEDYIQAELQAAGYNVCVHENLFLSAGGAWTLGTIPSDPSDFAQDIIFANGLFITGGFATGTILTSPDGISWTTIATVGISTISTICFGAGIYVASNLSGQFYSSVDLVNWTLRATIATIQTWKIIFAGTQFVASNTNNANNVLATSPDGITWTSRTGTTNSQWQGIAYNGSIYVMVSADSHAMSSPDGITWTSRTIPIGTYKAVIYANGIFVAVGLHVVATSPDGITWTSRTPAASNYWYSITWDNNSFTTVAISGTGNRVMTSPDGINWTIGITPEDDFWQAIVFGNNTLVAVGGKAPGNSPISAMYSTGGSYYHKTYAQFAGTGLVRHINTLLHGQQRHGYLSRKGVIVANSVDPSVDDSFDIGDGSDTIFIGGCPPGTFINIPKSQETAFRQFILKIKPVNITVLLLVNFV